VATIVVGSPVSLAAFRRSRLLQPARRARRRAFWPVEVAPRFRSAFRSLGPGRIAIDCGANVGRYTELMAERGADVLAFEPNPWAFAALQRRFAGIPSVRCLNAAVTDHDGRMRLYLHQRSDQDPVRWSPGSSLVRDKGNVSDRNWVEVETVDLDSLIAWIDRPVTLLKLDVEGAELQLLRRLIETGRIASVEHVLVEMHDQRVPSLLAEGVRVRTLLAEHGHDHVRLDWH
jgi:FkbM family methyltransferase